MDSPKNMTTVLISGGNQGIGYETAKLLMLSSRNYHIIVGSRSLPRGEEAVSSLSAYGSQDEYTAIQLDITDTSSITAAVETIASKYGHLDILINNAAIFLGVPSSSPQSQTSMLETTFETNVFGTTAVTEAFLPLLRKSPTAKIIVLSSSLGSLTMASAAPPHMFDVTAYRVSKAAMNMLVIEWVKAFAKDGIRVWGADPGLCTTNLVGPGLQEAAKKMGSKDPVEGARVVVGIVEGERDGDAGKVVYDEGVRPW